MDFLRQNGQLTCAHPSSFYIPPLYYFKEREALRTDTWLLQQPQRLQHAFLVTLSFEIVFLPTLRTRQHPTMKQRLRISIDRHLLLAFGAAHQLLGRIEPRVLCDQPLRSTDVFAEVGQPKRVG